MPNQSAAATPLEAARQAFASLPQLENASVFADAGAAEAMRWCGGLGYFVGTLGVCSVSDLGSPHDDDGPSTPSAAHGSFGGNGAVFFITSYAWDYTERIAGILRRGGFSSALVCCSVPEAAHAFHAAPLKESAAVKSVFGALTQDSNAEPADFRFAETARQLRADVGLPSPGQPGSVSPCCSVEIRYFHGLHYCTILDARHRDDHDHAVGGGGGASAATPHLFPHPAPDAAAAATGALAPAPPSVLIACGEPCTRAYPLMLTQLTQLTQLKRLTHGGGSAASAASAGHTHVKELQASDIPLGTRAAFKLLARSLALTLLQLGLDVEQETHAAGATAVLVGNAVVQMQGQAKAELRASRRAAASTSTSTSASTSTTTATVPASAPGEGPGSAEQEIERLLATAVGEGGAADAGGGGGGGGGGAVADAGAGGGAAVGSLVGETVTVHGLTSAAGQVLNGRAGRAESFDAGQGRYEVVMVDDGAEALLRAGTASFTTRIPFTYP
jgi:hypothetical protein